MVNRYLKDNRGFVQSKGIFFISIITLVVLAIVIVFFVSGKIKQGFENAESAREIAEQGLEISLKMIQQNPTWKSGFTNKKFKSGFYSVSIVAINDSLYKAVSTGYIKDVQKKITCTYQLEKTKIGLKPKTIRIQYN